MSDHPHEGWDDTPKRPGKWGGKSEGTPLGGEQSVGVPKTVKRSPPRGKDVLAVKAYFQSKLLTFSEVRHVPLWESVGKLHNNIDWLLTKQGHSVALLEGAIDFFASQVNSLVFQRGSSLWDAFFARREDALKAAGTATIGGRGEQRESAQELADRLTAFRQQGEN